MVLETPQGEIPNAGHMGGKTPMDSDDGGRSVRTPILCHTDLACNTSYHFAASRTVFPRVTPYQAWDRLRPLAYVYDSVASIHMTENPADMTSHKPKVALTYRDMHT